MPRGVYQRKPKTEKLQINKMLQVQIAEPVSQETDEEIEKRLEERFEVLQELTDAAIASDVNAMIV
jgi:hypothetical protein